MAILYTKYIKNHPIEDLIPNEVVGHMVRESLSPAAAWRKHLGLSQAEVAARIGISQPAYAQQEQAAKPRKATRQKIAAALGVPEALLDL
ncbi:helix-turn-helix domain-containing protein [Pseudomonas japonica]|uniref:helix-turn-helix domain-containing protein n=1 Tax=Pseudomonas japonica TaxID=256466 RepID=UPI0015E2C913|nr:helix-turn-helix transcriptional regulator [Pseudomonas japonica]MBA1242266.1 helix-turn-helix transcriptional regulator [Pseudomonas japonica]